MRQLCALLWLCVFSLGAWAQQGKAVYEKTCALCHATGMAGAPKFGSAADWSGRAARGKAVLYASALNGTPRGMPARGGNLELKDAEVKAAVDFMLSSAALPKPAVAKKEVPATETREKGETKKKPLEPAPASASAPAATSPPAPAARQADADVNAFNRLLRPASRRNPPPAEDGIHDPANDGTNALQAPRTAYATLPRANSGNRVDWVAALGQKRIQPRWDRADSKASGLVLDLNIVREVKGSMPDVVYPHKQHTEWLDCSNCHPAIFVPQKGANQISMAAILLGEKCGVCHGKVAFPVSECRLCHSKKKDFAGASPQAAGGAAK
jgi:c(7)-type cytochrome triheme protein